MKRRHVNGRGWMGAVVPVIGFLLFQTAFGQTTNYVAAAPAGNNGNSGADWANAWATLPHAVAESSSGDTLIVSNGVYALSSTLTIAKGLHVLGFGDSPDDVTIEPSAGRINLVDLEHEDALLENVTVRNGSRGIYVTGNATVRWCVITGNNATGVRMYDAGLVENSVISNNTASTGAGFVIVGPNPSGDRYVRGCLITDNNASARAGGIFASHPNVYIQNCTIVRNTSERGGGFFAEFNAGTFQNTIIMFNQARQGANSMGHGSFDSASFQTGSPDPQFMDLAGGDYRLRPGSPAIDTGIYAAWMDDAVDLDGNPRLDGTVDVGAYELARGALATGFQPSSRSGFTAETEIVLTAGVEGTNTSGLVYTWDFDNNGMPDASGADKAVVTNKYMTPGHKTVRLTIENAAAEQAEYLFENAVKIGPAIVYAARGTNTNTDTYPYADWGSAASNLQAAVDAAVQGSVVRVGAGVYPLTETLMISGGITVEGAAGAEHTILDGQSAVSCVRYERPWDTLDSVPFDVMQDVTIRNGRGNPAGGVWIPYGGILRGCIVSNNVNILFTSHGGVSVQSADALVDRCRILFNRGGRFGIGGAMLTHNAVLRNSLVYGNDTEEGSGSGSGGAGISFGGIVENCTVVWNRSGGESGAGGIHGSTSGVGSGTLRNSIVYFNVGRDQAVFPNARDDLKITFLVASTANLVGELVANVSGSTADPEFVADGENAGLTHIPGNYRLQAGSPAIDNGNFLAWMTDTTDVDGNPRIYGTDVDIGAFEWQPPPGTLILLR